jgi:hypothetical protein
MARKRKPTHVLVVWLDAAGGDDVDEPILALTTGWLLKETPEFIVVASELFEDGSSRDRTAIPQSLVRQVIKRNIRWPEAFKDWAPEK